MFKKERANQEAILHKQIAELQQQQSAMERNLSQIQQQKAEEQHSAQMQINMLQDNVTQLTTDLQMARKTAFDAKLRVCGYTCSLYYTIVLL